MKAILVAILISLGFLTPVKPVVVDGIDPGGQVGTYLEFWKRVSETGLPVIIDGACISACTLVLSQVPEDRICMTERGSFGFHAASDDNGVNIEITTLLNRTLFPEWVQEFIKSLGPLTDEVKYAIQDDFKDHIRKCTEDDLKTISAT